jgi:hypothetical protein
MRLVQRGAVAGVAALVLSGLPVGTARAADAGDAPATIAPLSQARYSTINILTLRIDFEVTIAP